MLHKLLSLRVWGVCAITAGLPAFLLGQLWQPLFLITFWPLFALALIGYALSPATAAKCPYCLKRVKLGATVCHHCSRSVAVEQ